MSKKFELLKRTYPISEFKRICDGYKYILDNIPESDRNDLGIEVKELQRKIESGEKYIYQVAKENGEFKTMCLCFSNYSIIRKHIFKIDDE